MPPYSAVQLLTHPHFWVLSVSAGLPPSISKLWLSVLSCLSGNSARLAQFVLQSDDPKIHPRLTSSLSFGMHFDSECKTRRHTVLCHLISQTVDEAALHRLWKLALASGERALVRQTEKRGGERRRSSDFYCCHSALVGLLYMPAALLLPTQQLNKREREHLQME